MAFACQLLVCLLSVSCSPVFFQSPFDLLLVHFLSLPCLLFTCLLSLFYLLLICFPSLSPASCSPVFFLYLSYLLLVCFLSLPCLLFTCPLYLFYLLLVCFLSAFCSPVCFCLLSLYSACCLSLPAAYLLVFSDQSCRVEGSTLASKFHCLLPLTVPAVMCR